VWSRADRGGCATRRRGAVRDHVRMSDRPPAPTRRNVNDMVREAKARIEELSIEQLQQEIDDGGVTLIDIRDPREQWERGAIPGARSMPRGMLEFWFDPDSKYYRGGLDFGERYVVYCAGGGRSALAADLLQDLGYTNVAHLTVGFNGWKQAGGAVEEVRPDPKYLAGA
jgi:rhodanese-related sulfurtransferase